MTGPAESPADAAEADRRALIDLLLAEEGLVALEAAGPGPRADPAAPAALSFAQQRLWFLEQFDPGGAAYHVPGALRLRGELDSGALRRALGRLVRRHEVLHTVFAATPEGPVQRPEPSLGPGWAEEDWTARPPRDDETALRARLAAEAAMPFDLARGPLLRARLIRLAPTEQVLALTLHHLVADQWSLGLLASELAAFYREEIGAGAHGLAPLPLQYADFAVWQRAWGDGPECRAQVEGWRAPLAGLAPLELPADFPRSAQPSPGAATHRFSVPAAVRRALEAQAQAEGATFFMALLAVFMAQLHRYTGRRDVAVGTPVTGRSRRETAPLIGFFTNTLVVRAQVEGEPTHREWLRAVRAACVDAYGRQDAPFELLVEALQPPRELDRHPWFDAMFVLQEPRPVPALAGLRAEYLETEVPAAKFDLTLTLLESDGGALAGALEYRPGLFSRETAERITAHFGNLAAAAAAVPDRPLLDLAMLDESERRRVLREFNATARSYAGEPLVHRLVEDQVARTPQGVAVADGRESLTYAELEARANRLARRLQRLGVGPDVIVGLCLGRTVDLAVGVLGVLKAGGCYLPLDPNYPADRLAYMLADAGARVLVAHAETRGVLAPPAGTAALDLDEDAAALAAESSARPASAVTGAHLLYVIYTSGSTGRPKGVTLSHAALHNLIRWHRETMLGGGRGLLFASLSFDVSFCEIFAALGSGGELYVAAEEIRRDVRALVAYLEEKRIEKVILPVVVMQRIAADHLDRAPALSGLREITTTGEALVITPPMIEFFRRLPQCALHNHYGPSETHVVTAYRFAGPPDRLRPPPPIGRPVANTQAYILDRRGHPAALGVPGELFLGGANLGRNYHGRPDLTAERFVPDPFAAAPGARLYRTGDLARWRPDGEIEFLGRLDDQVKIRGFRVEPGEIETLLAKHPAIAAAAVVARERSAGEKILVGYVVRRDGAAMEIAGLRAFLGGQLPDYMVPSAFVELAALPLTPSGKVDRRALPAAAPDRLARDAAFVPPGTETERLVAEVWSELLGGARIGLDDNFFHLGGHSLLAARLVAGLRARTELELPLRAVFEQPTLRGCVAALAAVAGGREIREKAGAGVSEPAPRRSGEAAPLAFAQERLWFLQRLEAASRAYHLGQAFRLRGPLDAGALGRAVDGLVRRHDALRTGFAADAAGRAQPETLLPAAIGGVLRRLDLTSRPEPRRAAEAAEEEFFSAPFDLAQPPLFRALLLTLAADEHRLAICVHHLGFDGWSIAILARELSEGYAAETAGGPWRPPPLPLGYGDYAAWQRRRAGAPAWGEALAWWENHLRGVPPLELPTDRPRPARVSGRGAGHRFTVAGGVAGTLRALAQREGATLFSVLLAAYETLLFRHTAQRDFGVGVSVAGRTHRALEGLVGMFVNTVVFRADLVGDPSFVGLVRRVRDEALEVLARQETPFEQIVDRLHPERDLSRNPVFQAGLFLQNAPAADFRLGSAALEPVVPEIRAAKFDLLVSLEEIPGGELRGSIEFSTDLFDAETIARIGERYVALLAAAASGPEKRLSELAWLPAAEEAEVRRWSAGPSRVFSDDGWIHELPDRHPPGAVALSGPDGRRLTYGQFAGEAERLARALRGLGARPEILVGVCLERSPELVIALHAVLRAGAAYVPLDPDYPAERLAWMAGDAGASIVVTTRALAARLPGCAAKMLFIEEPWPDGPARGARPDGQNAAYLIYTSGSTGRPKGAINTHEAIRNMLRWIQAEFPLTAADVFLQKTPCSFDVSVREFFWPLLAGAELTIAEPGAHRDPARIIALIRRRGVTVVDFVPSVFRAFLDAPEVERCGSLRWVFCTGEELPRDLVEKCRDRLGCGLHNLYGPTEAAVEFTHYACGREEGPVPIGRPMANLEVQILDAAFAPVPRGVTGEIYLGGVGLARGYRGRPDLTADRWRPHPRQAGRRLYQTGDLGRWRPDGNIDYLGRTDFQVKLRGQRIELGEIESVLREHGAVREAAVVVRDGRLVAYVVPRAGAISPEELRGWLSARLPEYMVPPSWVELGALPLNPAGKTDRKALPAPAAAGLAGYEAPRGEREEMLAECWREVLRVPRIGRGDGYFELGGDSILSIPLQARARARGWDFELADLFQHQTLAALALALRPAAARGGPAAAAAFALLGPADRARLPAGLEDAYPLTALQAGMVLHAELNPGSAVYHEVFSYEVRAPWSEDALRGALGAMARRHPVLRTSFELRGFSEPLQCVHRGAPTPLAVVDARGRPRSEQDAAVSEWIGAELARGFPWAEAPLWRARAQRRTDASWEFTFSAHHAILDGWSVAALLAGLFEEYLERAAGRPPATRPAPPAFAQYVALERAALASAASRQFWSEQLAEPTVGRLPRRSEASRHPDNGKGGAARRQASAWRSWRGAELAALQALAARAGVSLKHVLLAAHLRVAQVYTAQSDVITGVITNGRPEEADAEETLGLFLNTLPLRVRLGPGTWLEWLRAMLRAEEAAWPHRRYPLAELQKGLDRRALFETAFNYVHYHGLDALRARPDVELLGARYFDENSFSYFAQYSLDTVREELVLELRYDAAEFTAEQAEEFAAANRTALAAMTADPAAHPASASLLSAGEFDRTMRAGAAAPVPPGAPRLLHGAFFAAASRVPEAVALVDGSRRMTYAELAGRVQAWAARLRELGAGPERLVGVCLERGADLVTALLAVLESGAAYVPLDPSYPSERLAFLCADAQVGLLVSRPELASRLPSGPWRRVDPAELAALPRRRPAPPRPRRTKAGGAALPGNLAYLIYTSGSTGRPKAAAIEHRSACALLAWARAEYPAGELGGTLASTSVSFDLSVFEIFATLAAGGKVILAENALALPSLPARGEVTLLNTVPSAAAELVRQRAIPPSVRVVNLAGEPLSAALADQLYGLGTVEKVYDLYGPSEDTTYSTWARRVRGGPATIGRALPGSSLYLVDEFFQPVPLGAVGEIVLGGAGLARGYLGRPDLTAERFVPDPFAAVPGGRLYRTGDLARHREDGQLEFLGRADHQVKLRGFRIELGEIQAVLEQHPSVAESAVVAREDGAGRKQLAAYVAGPAAAAVPEAELRAWVAARLPEYFMPAVWVALPRLPRTPNGKLDRAALSSFAPGGASADGARPDRVEPRTREERALARIWEDVLQVSRIGADDDFFALGGDSILALQVAARSRDAGLAITPRLLFEHPTVATLAAAGLSLGSFGVGGVAGARTAPSAPGVSGAPRNLTELDDGALTPIQHWFFAQNFAEPHHWNQSVLLRAREPLDARALAKALAAVGERHSALRRRFERGPDGRWRSWAGEGPAFAFRSIGSEAGPGGRARPLAPSDPGAGLERAAGRDRPALPSSQEITAICTAEQAALDLEKGPLARAVWIAGDATDPGRLFIVIHHLAVDGVSWRILLEELWTAYEAELLAGEAGLFAGQQALSRTGAALAAPTASPTVWARWLHTFAGQGGFASEQAHWSALAARPADPLPRDLTGGENRVESAGTLSAALDAGETEALLRRAQAAHGCRIDDLLLAALALALREWTGREAHVLHLEGHGREAAESGLDLSGSVGWLTTLYPVRLDLRGAAEATRALGAVVAQLAAVPERGLGYGVGRFLQAPPAWPEISAEICFNYLGQFDGLVGPQAPFAPAAEAAGPPRSPRGGRAHLIEVNGLVTGGKLRFEWHYPTAILRKPTVERLAGRHLVHLRALIAAAGPAPARPAFSGVSETELDRAISEIEL